MTAAHRGPTLNTMHISKILIGHVSAETAYVVDDYPYGFRLRCRKRTWLEYKPGKGVRLMAQTTNPKIKDSEVWNKPKASTYSMLGGCMYLDDEGQVQWSVLSQHSSGDEARVWREIYGAGVPDAARDGMDTWVECKIKAEGTFGHGEE